MEIGTSGDLVKIDTLVAGDALSFEFQDATYPATLYTLQFVISLNGSKTLEKDGSAIGVKHTVALESSDTSGLKLGRCQVWLVFTLISDSAQRFTLYAGLLSVLPNPLGNLKQTEAMLSLAAVNRTIQMIIAQPESSAMYNGQSYTTHNIKDLYDIRNMLQAQVDSELRSMGLPSKSGHKTIRTRFV